MFRGGNRKEAIETIRPRRKQDGAEEKGANAKGEGNEAESDGGAKGILAKRKAAKATKAPRARRVRVHMCTSRAIIQGIP